MLIKHYNIIHTNINSNKYNNVNVMSINDIISYKKALFFATKQHFHSKYTSSDHVTRAKHVHVIGKFLC